MRSVNKYISAVFCFAIVLLMVSSACAQDMNAIKSQMVNRKPTIDGLKNKGIVGEGNDGYLHFRQKTGEGSKVVKAENNDRMVVYSAIAKKQGTTPEKVGKRRALQIAGIAAAGQWLQKGDGTWYKK